MTKREDDEMPTERRRTERRASKATEKKEPEKEPEPDFFEALTDLLTFRW